MSEKCEECSRAWECDGISYKKILISDIKNCLFFKEPKGSEIIDKILNYVENLNGDD